MLFDTLHKFYRCILYNICVLQLIDGTFLRLRQSLSGCGTLSLIEWLLRVRTSSPKRCRFVVSFASTESCYHSKIESEMSAGLSFVAPSDVR